MRKIPYIFVFDIDKTILGDVNYILCEHQFNKNIIDTSICTDFFKSCDGYFGRVYLCMNGCDHKQK